MIPTPRLFLPLLLVIAAAVSVPAADRLELRKDDHIAILGNTLADRMQHSGWLETLVHAKFPRHDLVFRNLGFAGDELTLRARSQDFGTPDEWLRRVQADVVLAFFGFNESFKGQPGLETFRKDLDKFITDTLKQDYSGRGAPRLVLFSPIAQEKHSDPNFPDPAANNDNIKLYAGAMAEIARAKGVLFVDLFALSQQAYAQAKESLTANGLHLTDAGYRALAPGMFQALLGEAPPAMDGAAFEKLRAAVNAKNAEWFKRYRTVDGFNVYGGRSRLSYEQGKGGPKLSNNEVMQREMSIRDVMTANRDQRVWAVAKGGDLVVKDDNLPKPIEVVSNKPGKNPDGTHSFLSGEEAMARMKVAQGCKLNLFASEDRFPALVNPVQMAFDTRGRLWVAAWLNYPGRTPWSQQGDSLLVFEDTDNDGRADKCTPFEDDLNCPTGFQFYKDGVIVVQAPDVWFLRDTDGDGRADWKERILNGLDSADSHHTANSLVLDPGGAIYLSDGVFHRTQTETALGPVRSHDGAIFRFDPRTGGFEIYAAYGFANPHGRVFDHWGNDLITDATGNNTYYGPAISGRIDFPAKHSSVKQFWDRPARPCPGTGMLSSRHFPEEFQGNFLNANVIGFQGIYRVKVREEGSGLWGDTLPDHLVQSDDPNFRPTAVDVAPDGSIYFLDWHNPIIGHMQHHLRDPSRDHAHGRVYRITHEGRPLTQPARIAGEPVEKLLDLLKEPEDNVRTRAKIEMGARDSRQVVAAAQKWAAQFDAQRVEHQHHLLEALWVHQWHNVVNEPLLRQMLQSPEPRARAQAVRVLGYWRDRVREPLALLRAAANDPAPRVRLEAVRVASFFAGSEAIEIAYEIQKHETDYYLDYVFKETMKQLQKGGKGLFLPKDPVALARVVGNLSNPEILQAPEVEPILIERLQRKGIEVNARNKALDKLVALHKTDRVKELLASLQRLDAGKPDVGTVKDLAVLLSVDSSALVAARQPLTDLAQKASQVSIRRAAFASLVVADGKPDAVWAGTEPSPNHRIALIDSIILLLDPSARAAFQPLLVAALQNPKTPHGVHTAALRALPLMGTDHAQQNFAILARHLAEGRELTTAATAVMQFPRDTWDKSSAGPAAEAILAWARKVPADRRTSQEFIETVQVGSELASLLPAADSTRIRKELLSLGVRVFVLKTVREAMRYDNTRLVVEAGKPFEIIFENVDMMPHNLVITQPGAREEVGTQGEKMKPVPDNKGRLYVPDNKKVIAASKMLEPGQKEVLKLTAPAKPGDYDFLCTYPEHWKVMFGTLVVAKDADAVLRASAEPAAPQKTAGAAAHVHHH